MFVYRITTALIAFLSRRLAKAATRQAALSTRTAELAADLAKRSTAQAQDSMKAAKLGQRLNDLTGE